MKKIPQKTVYIILLLLALTPLIWFQGRPNVLITGSDTNFPLQPQIWFMRRFYIWNNIINAGVESASSVAGTFFHLIQFIPYKIGFGLQAVEIISLIFWFASLIFVSYLLATRLFEKQKLPRILFVILYSFNTYIFNTWENVKVANLSLNISIALGLFIYLSLRDNKISRQQALIYSFPLGIYAAGAGINPAYYLTFLLAIFVAFLIEFLNPSFENIKKATTDFLTIFIPTTLLNIFWMIPTLRYIFSTINPQNSITNIGYTDWISSLSQNTNIFNVLRLQGAWDWYAVDDKTGAFLYIPYADKFFNHPIFMAFSISFFLLALLSYFFVTQKNVKNYLIFSLMLLIGVFMGVGVNGPTGQLFKLFIKYIPFFSLFRSPWYIFTPLLTISYAALIGYLFNNLNTSKISKYLKFKSINIINLAATIYFVGILFYNYPLITGKIFRPDFDGSFYINFPDYIFATREYLNNEDLNGRLLLYPDDGIERFEWGYGAVDSLLALMADNELVLSPLSGESLPLVRLINYNYLQLKRSASTSVSRISEKLNAKNLFIKNDQISLAPELDDKFLQNKTFSAGEWEIYKIPSITENRKIFSPTNAFFAYPYDEKSVDAASGESIILNPADTVVNKISKIPERSGIIIQAQNQNLIDYQNYLQGKQKPSDRLVHCDFSTVVFNLEIQKETQYQPVLERFRLEKFGINPQTNLNVSVDGQNKTFIYQNSDDSFVYYEPIYFSPGEYEITINLSNQSLYYNFGNMQTNGEIHGDLRVTSSDGILELQSTNTKVDSSYDIQISGFDPMLLYYISTNYQELAGDQAALIAFQSKNGGPIKQQVAKLPNFPYWQEFGFYFSPVLTPSDLAIRLAAISVKEPYGARISYRDIKLESVFTNRMLFIKEGVPLVENQNEITYQQKSSVKYVGQVENNANEGHFIVFSENYTPDWEFKITTKGLSHIKPLHFSGNLYANTWYIDTPESYEFEIHYKPQNWLLLGHLISATSLVALVAFSVYYYNAKRHK